MESNTTNQQNINNDLIYDFNAYSTIFDNRLSLEAYKYCFKYSVKDFNNHNISEIEYKTFENCMFDYMLLLDHE